MNASVPTCGRGIRFARLAGALVACVVITLACTPQQVMNVADALPVRELAPNVFVHAGKQEEAGPGNLGDIANIGFVVGSRCIAVIDTGGSLAVGMRLRRAIRKVSSLPICYVINTHVHPDHIFGNAAFRDDKPVFIGHSKLPAAMAARGANYRNALYRDLGSGAQGSELVPPTRLVRDAEQIDLGGRVLDLRAWPTAHTDNDLTVFDPHTGTLWASDLLFVKRIPVVDGSLRGWLAGIEELRRLDVVRVIPGHGDAGQDWRDALEEQERYLSLLLRETRAAIRAKRTIRQAVEEVALHEQDNWLLFEGFHKRNVTAAYAELEWED